VCDQAIKPKEAVNERPKEIIRKWSQFCDDTIKINRNYSGASLPCGPCR